jgi:hypothetical protein
VGLELPVGSSGLLAVDDGLVWVCRDRFGRWNEALRQAGLTPRHPISVRDS